jgi:hypothetical protein
MSGKPTPHRLYFKKSAYNWLTFCRTMPPCFDAEGRPIAHTKFGEVWFRTKDLLDVGYLLLNGKIMYSFWIAVGDDFDVTRWMFADLPCDLDHLLSRLDGNLRPLVGELEQKMTAAVSFKLNAGKRVGNFNLARCRGTTDAADLRLLGALNALTAWDAVELLYSRVVRTSFDDAGEEE